MDLAKKIAILILLVTIGISVKMIIERETLLYTNPEIAGQTSSWLYRKSIHIEGKSRKISPERETLLTIDTKELILKGKLQPSCNDIRFLDEDNQTPLEYWFEEKDSKEYGCNTTKTKIWVKVASFAKEGKTIYFLYGNSTAPNLNDN
jgi:hypothetical protein